MVLLLLAILVIPIEVELSTLTEKYEIRVGKIVNSGLEISDEGIIAIRIKMVWWDKKFILFPPTAEIKKDEKKNKPQPKNKKNTLTKENVTRIFSVVKSFKVIRFYINIDTDDYILNAFLYPLFFVLKKRKGLNIQVNYEGLEELDILIKNNLMRMGIAYLRNK